MNKNFVAFRVKFVGQYCNQAIGFPSVLLGALFGASDNVPSGDAVTTDPSELTKPNYPMDTTTVGPTGSINCNQFFKLSIATCMPDSCSNNDVRGAFDVCKFKTSHFLIFSRIWT